MPGQDKGEGGIRGVIPGRPHLDTPDLMIHQARPASEWRPAFLGPPLAAFVPADGFSADRVAPAGPVEAQGLAGRRADDINGLAENAHVASRPSPGWSRPSSRFDFLRPFRFQSNEFIRTYLRINRVYAAEPAKPRSGVDGRLHR